MLAKAEKLAGQARCIAQVTTRWWAEHASWPEDLGVLFCMNKRWMRGNEQVEQFMKNMTAFHTGQAYWAHIDWETVCPPMTD
jgi:hypothetical protein